MEYRSCFFSIRIVQILAMQQNRKKWAMADMIVLVRWLVCAMENCNSLIFTGSLYFNQMCKNNQTPLTWVSVESRLIDGMGLLHRTYRLPVSIVGPNVDHSLPASFRA